MKKQLSFITCILLTLILSASAFGGQSLDAEAAAKVKYSYTKIDDSRVLPGGRFDNYFKYPKLKG
ncbi:MAG: hypothetical protein IJ679_09705 [Lachnospiraceae bacterium]|nr:hypothetical protein [Lachnospiraceae bacterium]